MNNYYTYINNTFQCLSNEDSSQLYLYGCLLAEYNEKTKHYDCFKCKNNFIQISNDKTCRKLYEIGIHSECLEVVNLGTVENP